MPQGRTLDADAELVKRGWVRWPDFTDHNLRKKIKEVHLRVEVWEHAKDKKVAVTFGGTIFTNLKDWSANLRWFIPTHNDQYSVVVKTFGDVFVRLYIERTASWSKEDVSIYSTGHSLGGGLAQQFAYALPINHAVPPNEGIPRVKKVYAFDPSPVTGFYSVGRRRRTQNCNGLAIDRIYERREILAYLRSIMNFIYPPSAKNPAIRQLRYNLFPTKNPFAGHSISDFAYCLNVQLTKLQPPDPLGLPAAQSAQMPAQPMTSF
jgi:pimeloyl-ACP methyl ester carboxylesterase